MNLEDKNLIRSLAAMGGGIASRGGSCGSLIGGLAFLGSLLGKEEPQEKDQPIMWRSCHEFYKKFASEVAGEWGSLSCRDIAGVDWKNRGQAKEFYRGVGRIECSKNTGKAPRILDEILTKHMDKGGVNDRKMTAFIVPNPEFS